MGEKAKINESGAKKSKKKKKEMCQILETFPKPKQTFFTPRHPNPREWSVTG
jgi:hypothetical protein